MGMIVPPEVTRGSTGIVLGERFADSRVNQAED
jgi:hypothetical protein